MYLMQSVVYTLMITSFLTNISVSMLMSSFNVIMGNMAEGIVGRITRQEAYRNLSSSCL